MYSPTFCGGSGIGVDNMGLGGAAAGVCWLAPPDAAASLAALSSSSISRKEAMICRKPGLAAGSAVQQDVMSWRQAGEVDGGIGGR